MQLTNQLMTSMMHKIQMNVTQTGQVRKHMKMLLPAQVIVWKLVKQLNAGMTFKKRILGCFFHVR